MRDGMRDELSASAAAAAGRGRVHPKIPGNQVFKGF